VHPAQRDVEPGRAGYDVQLQLPQQVP
jgi:hypothetical protein